MTSQVLQATPHNVGLKKNTVYSSFCTTLITSGKLFDTTSTGKFPSCPHSIQDASSLVVKVSKLIHVQPVRRRAVCFHGRKQPLTQRIAHRSPASSSRSLVQPNQQSSNRIRCMTRRHSSSPCET